MVAPGNVNPKGAQAPPPPLGQPRPIKTAGAGTPDVGLQSPEGGYQGVPRPPSATQHNTDVLHQRRNMPGCPIKMALGGVAFIGVVWYFTLYSKKKPEATALDVAKVATGSAAPENTRPRK
ncbi:hypothetical protein ACS0TY_028847 [Phlomoides rotata]